MGLSNSKYQNGTAGTMNEPQHPYTDYQKQQNRKFIYVVAIASILFSGLLLTLLFVTADKEEIKEIAKQSDDVIDLLNMDSVKQEAGDIEAEDIALSLPQGGWVQQTDSDGNLIQQYRCESLDPNPPDLPNGWLEMSKPEIEIFLSEDKLVRITGDHGIANAPKRILESGEIAGRVVVSMYETKNWKMDETQPSPTMVLTTPQVSFDNFIGEINCDGEIRLESNKVSLSGKQLTIRFNDLEGRIEYLQLAEVDYIDLYPEERLTFSKYQQAQLEINPKMLLRKKRGIATISPQKPSPEYYIATLNGNIAVQQGDETNGLFATGNRLTIAFSEDSNKTQASKKQQILLTNGLPQHLASLTLGTHSLSENNPVRINCDDGLTLVPLKEKKLFPSTKNESRIELFGTLKTPAKLIDREADLVAFGTVFSHEVNANISNIFGEPAVMEQNEFSINAPNIWLSQQEGSGGALGEGTILKKESQEINTTLNWTGSVDFKFSPTENDDSGQIEQIVCNENVILENPDSVLTCQNLEVNFKTNSDGSSSPHVAIARTDVKATSESQTLWANQAEVTFTESSHKQNDKNGDLLGGSKADSMHAEGDVQVLLPDGGRAFCNTLTGNINQEEAILSGNVVVAYDQILMNRGEEAILTLNKTKGIGRWNGPGQALFLETPIDVSQDKRIERPNASPSANGDATEISMRANWHQGLTIDQRFNDNAGAVTLNGEVDMRSSQTPLDQSHMTGDEIRLEFDLEDEEKSRTLQNIIAKNNAQIEHRVWTESTKKELPVVYYVGGEHIEYSPVTQQMIAVGNGELVLRDARVPENELHQSSLAGRGTTRFTWSEKLSTKQISEVLYLIRMSGDVEMVHKDLGGSIGMLTADTFEAIATDPNPEVKNENTHSEISLKGLDLRQLRANGSVYVDTQTRRVDCDTFDYNLLTGFAELNAAEGETVAIVTAGSTYPVRAESVLWNMDPAVDSITIRGLQGEGSN